jgi:L-threonylcarbamoyladenylate synthase
MAMAEILQIDPKNPEPERIARAAALIRHSEVIAIPTDTLYGLAANPFDHAAVETVFAIKGRPKHNPLLLLVDSLEMAAELSAQLPATFHKLAAQFWPGPLTIVVSASAKLSSAVTAGTGTIGLRLPQAPIAVALIRAAACPVTATSANRSGEPDSSSAEQVARSLGDQLPLILDGGSSSNQKPSTVIDLSSAAWRMVREGAISRREIEDCLRS